MDGGVTCWFNCLAGSDCGAKGPLIGYSFMDVVNATNNFKEQIGEGSYGPTYKGRLSDGKEVLVKRCRPSRKLSTLQFLAEVSVFTKQSILECPDTVDGLKHSILACEHVSPELELSSSSACFRWSTSQKFVIEISFRCLVIAKKARSRF